MVGDPSPPAADADNQAVTPVIGIGASAGGLEALERFFKALPGPTGASFVVVVHLSPDFKSMMPELLARHTPMPVSAAELDVLMQPDHVYIIPPRKNITVVAGSLRLREQVRRPGQAVNLPVDEFLLSLANERGDQTIAVILSGSGSDGSRGIRSIKEAGGMVFVQDPGTAQFDGMPQSALATGLADYTGAPAAIAGRIAAILRHTPTLALDPHQPSSSASAAPANADESMMDTVFTALRNAPNRLDLSYYRRDMVHRRVRRRMVIHSIADSAEYLDKLRDDPLELTALQQDLLIGVTAFFRDKSPFQCLRKQHIPHLLKRGDGPLRVWVPACSTGEEAYSIAMLIEEANDERDTRREYKVFATDVDERALGVASQGRYPLSTMMDVDRGRISRFFQHVGGHYLPRPYLRERLVFARHNLVRDAPFSKMHLVSCRNFLIYLRAPQHEQVLAALHFSLAVGGVLLLGSSEAVAPYDEEFDVLDAGERIFRKRRAAVMPALRRRNALSDPIARPTRLIGASAHEETFRRVLERVAELESRTYVILDVAGHVHDVVGDAASILRVPAGKPTTKILRMVIDELRLPLSTALQKLATQEGPVSYSIQRSQTDGDDPSGQFIHFQLCHLPSTRVHGARLLLVVDRRSSAPGADAVLYATPESAASEVYSLEAQLRQAQESLQATVEELQSINEEQQATNEELIASNEELQSTNEELHSVNEELHTVNTEFRKKNRELTVLTNDWNHLIRAIDVATLYLDKDLTVRRFTPAITSVVNLLDHDIGRPIEHFAHNLDDNFLDDIRRVSQGHGPIERQIRSSTGGWMLMRIQPYSQIEDDDVTGVVATFIDITGLKNTQESTRLISEQFQLANEQLLRRSDELEEIFSIVAHDIKRPVGSIDGLLQLTRHSLVEQQSEPDPHTCQQAIECVDNALSECRRLQRLLQDLRRITVVERADVDVEELDLQPWFDAVVAPSAERATELGVTFNGTCDNARVRVARMVLEQTLSNLIENAFNYGAGHPEPRVDVSCSVLRDEVRISVVDNGKGIAPEHHDRVFEIFRRLDPGAAEGSGVGLVVVRRLVSKAGGTVHVISDVGQGAQFVVQIPAERIGAQTRPQWVLLVEDDALDAKLASKALTAAFARRQLPVEIDRARSLAEAEARLSERAFDAVVLDLSLPDGHGLALVSTIMEAEGDAVPVVILSGHGDGMPESFVTESKIAVFLPKADLGRDSMYDALDRAMTLARSRTRLSRPTYLPPASDT